MLFTNPLFLWGLLAIGIPVVIHLFNFRRFKKVYFSNVSFLEELKVQTQKYSRLKHLLILALRILAIASLVFAFSQPFISGKDSNKIIQGKNAVSIFIDNSFSMESVTDQTKLLDIAKEKAREIVTAYPNADDFQLLTHDFEGKHQHLFTKEEFLQMLDEISITPNVKKISEIYKRQQDALNLSPQSNKISYIISDFQKSISDFNQNLNDSSISTYLIPVTPQKNNNVFIDSCWFDTPVLQINKNVKLIVKIKNSSEFPVENIPVKLIVNGNQRAIASVDINEKEELIINLSYKITESGIQNAYIEITDYPIIYDDKFYFSYKVANNIPVLIINNLSENQFINKLYGLDSIFSLANTFEKNINFSAFAKTDLIILNGLKNIPSGLAMELKRFTENGGSLAIFPDVNIDFDNYKQLSLMLNIPFYETKDSTDSKVEKINIQHPVFSDVFDKIPENIDLPKVYSFYTFSKNSISRNESLLTMLNGRDFLSSSTFGNGIVYQSAVPIDAGWSNFPRHAIFVPALFNIALQSQPNNKLFYTIGNDESIKINKLSLSGEETFLLKSDKAGFEIIPEHKNVDSRIEIYFHNQILEANNYHLFKGEQKIIDVSYNYDRKESSLDFNTYEELEKRIKDTQLTSFKLIDSKNKHLGELIKEINQGTKLWKIFVILALIFLLGETILIRLWK